MKLYECSILIEGALESMETAFKVINNIFNSNEPCDLQENKDFKFQLDTIIVNINFIFQSICKIDMNMIKDEDIKNEIKSINYMIGDWAYYCDMINCSLSCKPINRIVVDTDVKRYLSLIYNSTGECLNLARNIKFSDYCYVERGLLKPEDVGYTKEEVGFDIKKNEITAIFEPKAPTYNK